MEKGAVMVPFSKSHKKFFGYFDPENIFQMIKINIFWGDLTDISAKKLVHSENWVLDCVEATVSASVFKIK